MKQKKIRPIPYRPLGKLTISASGLRKMANALQKKHKTKGDVLVDSYVEYWMEKDKTKYTIGVII